MEDDMGNLWFGTGAGINIYSPSAYPFNHFTHIPGISNSPEGYVVSAVEEDNENNLWIGYEKDGLDYFDRKNLSFTHFRKNINDINSIASNKVSALYYDDHNRLWIGLWRGIGFNLLEDKGNRFIKYTYNSQSLEQDWYSDFIADLNGNIYVGFWGATGLTAFDSERRQFQSSYMKMFGRIGCSRLITKLLCDNNGTIWFGTTDCGLHKLFPEKDSAVSYFSDEETNHGLSANNVADITIDNNGSIWIINDKLQKYIPENDTFISYGYQEGLTTDDLASVTADNYGNIWIGTKSDGLFKFDTTHLSFNQYLKQDGLQSNSFTTAALKLESGEVFLGNQSGFNLFKPDEIVEDTIVPNPYFGRLYVYDHILSHDLNDEEIIILEPDQNVFTVELMSSDIINPGRYSYMCMLGGYDNDWVEINNEQRIARYAAVPPGFYTLRYRIGNRKGLWSDKTAEISFKINKPYYLTWWFISLAFSFISIVLILIVKQREFDLKQKQRNIELQQRLFRLQMNPHFMYNSLLAIQNYIFMHSPQEAGNYLSDFARLFRLILNNSRSEFIQLSKEIETLNLYLKLQTLRYPYKFSYDISVDDEIDDELIMIPPMLAQPMIENALEHGLFYKKGHGHLNIRFLYKGNELLFEVEDNGIGFTKAKEKKEYVKGHKSSAIDITRERIKILGKRHGFFAIFEIKELKDKNNEVLGTKVSFNLPTKLSLFENIDS